MRKDSGKKSAFFRRAGRCLPLALIALLGLMFPFQLRAQDSVCAEVKIVIEQKLPLERQAFDAHMIVRNGLEDSLTDLKVELEFMDQDQRPVVATNDPDRVGADFFYRIDRMEGVSGLDGGVLSGKTTADIHWLIIPSQGAGGGEANGRMYYIGAKISYALNGRKAAVDVAPDYVVVLPQPLLELDYFLPTDVYADDPLTLEVEPSEPFTLGVRVSNVGAGVSAKTVIDSAQAKIVDNRQGLPIDFRILGGYVGNDMRGKSWLLDLGDIPPGKAKAGRWVMEASLAGRFVDFKADFSHSDSLGGAVSSLVKETRARKLERDVLVDLPGHDDEPDFLVETGDGYRVYGSDGADADALDVSSQAILTKVSDDKLRLSFPYSANLAHVKLPDPFDGKKTLARVVRSDGKVLSPRNFWLSKTQNADLSWSHFLRVFDCNAAGDYILEFAPNLGAVLSGGAWRDGNGNGVRERDEPPEGNLGVILKGVDSGGRNIWRQARTDSLGAFSFTGLDPGVYRLEAEPVDGWIDGAFAAGGAGGTSGPGFIKGIELAPGANAAGYMIAKRRPVANAPEGAADVSIAIKTDRPQLRGNETASVEVSVRNLGEDEARGVTAQVALPLGLSLQSVVAGVGEYADGVWSIGGLAKDQSAALTLGVKADRAADGAGGGVAWPVSVGAAASDPDFSNNSALLGLTVLPDSTNAVEITQSLPSQTLALMLVSCPSAAPTEQAACEKERAQAARAALDGRARSLKTVTTAEEWRFEQRGGSSNTLWLHGGAGKLDEQDVAEIRAAELRGATLIVDAFPDSSGSEAGDRLLETAMGVRFVRPPIGAGRSVVFPNESTARIASGKLNGLLLASPSARSLAQSADAGVPVIAAGSLGLGRSWVLGFDLIASMNGEFASFWKGYAERQLNDFAPLSRSDPALAGSKLPLRIVVRNGADAGAPVREVRALARLPVGMGHGAATPAPARDEPQLVEWAWSPEPGQSLSAEMTLTLPQTAGDVQEQVLLLDESSNLLDVKTMPIAVADADGLARKVDEALTKLQGGAPETQQTIDGALQAAAAARAGRSQGEWDVVLRRLADLLGLLDDVGFAGRQDIESLRLDAARWMGAEQLSWARHAAPHPVRLTAASGSGQFAQVNGPFARPLQARAEGADGLPFAGATVRFEAPSAGPGAYFEGGKRAAESVTDEFGLAVSPPLTANSAPGRYVVKAQTGGAAPIGFALSNRGGLGPDGSVSLRMASGDAQTAQIGAPFGSPLVVQALNSAGRPAAGVATRFDFPTHWASARFADGEPGAVVLTDEEGYAASPEFKANYLAGSYRARASVDGKEGGVDFSLSNSVIAPTLKLTPVAGVNQSAAVGAAYGQRISVRVVNGQGIPKPAVIVRFSLPSEGPSAFFDGNKVAASALTGADGVAVSPALTANELQGSFRVVVTANGAARPLMASFENRAAESSEGSSGRRPRGAEGKRWARPMARP